VLGQGYRNAALSAKIAATLQFLTGGRFILGLGAGDDETE
jgi:alkanesulfonate monooxygenase SsuD/methylene tetrahydromethanopterin reductase-like flavin-dependent oxidoreductase (luciferase family)